MAIIYYRRVKVKAEEAPDMPRSDGYGPCHAKVYSAISGTHRSCASLAQKPVPATPHDGGCQRPACRPFSPIGPSVRSCGIEGSCDLPPDGIVRFRRSQSECKFSLVANQDTCLHQAFWTTPYPSPRDRFTAARAEASGLSKCRRWLLQVPSGSTRRGKAASKGIDHQ